MSKERCRLCNGCGEILGMGMVKKDCDECSGTGSKIIEDDIDYLMQKNSNAYVSAVSKIMNLDQKLTLSAAEKILDEELYRQSFTGLSSVTESKISEDFTDCEALKSVDLCVSASGEVRKKRGRPRRSEEV